METDVKSFVLHHPKLVKRMTTYQKNELYSGAFKTPVDPQACHMLRHDKWQTCHPTGNNQESIPSCSIDMKEEELIDRYNHHMTCRNYRALENNSSCFETKDEGHREAQIITMKKAEECAVILMNKLNPIQPSTQVKVNSYQNPFQPQPLQNQKKKQPQPPSQPQQPTQSQQTQSQPQHQISFQDSFRQQQEKLKKEQQHTNHSLQEQELIHQQEQNMVQKQRQQEEQRQREHQERLRQEEVQRYQEMQLQQEQKQKEDARAEEEQRQQEKEEKRARKIEAKRNRYYPIIISGSILLMVVLFLLFLKYVI